MLERRAIAIRGVVRGVGFRPFVFNLASKFELGGFVRNSTSGVKIEVEGESGRVEAFFADLTNQPPPLARIEAIGWEPAALRGETAFRIEQSIAEPAAPVSISPDVATCDDCLAELFNPADRRYRYPFLNCTNCGPRLTIVTGAPYDRHRTTMATFGMCDDCRREYDDPTNRRFHAQPTACAVCGPRLIACAADGSTLDVQDPLLWFVQAIREGRIAAMKGLGGYHLVCDAQNPEAVAELRRRKHRDEKPFAIMVRDLDLARRLCDISDAEAELLASPRRP
ncbi:MAG TPA: acylphosphatase, partial [Tepidisphaeraceae bacterium]|nr:acylphosphatase [Tepidisphaeraceae bacterium]